MASDKKEIKVPSVCILYNQKGCSKNICSYLHLCKGYIDETCDGCALSHDIKAEQPTSVLSACGLFPTSMDECILLDLYRVRSQRQQSRGQTDSTKLHPPSICFYYNEKGCQKSDCTYVHICKKYVYNCCELENCQLSHDIKEGQAWKKLSLYGFNTNMTADEIRKAYMKSLIRTTENPREKSAGRGTKDDTRKVRSGEDFHKERKGKPEDRSSHEDSETCNEKEDTQYPYLICEKYNQKKCQLPQCKYLHICGKFVLDQCGNSCTKGLNHRLFYVNNKPVLHGAGYDTDQNESDLLEEYKRKSQKMFASWKQRQHQPMSNTDISRQESHQPSTHKNIPYLVCRNFNTKGCGFDSCKYLHICSDYIVGRCEKGQQCEKNHNLFFGNNKTVLDKAGYDTTKPGCKILDDYRMNLKDRSQSEKPKEGNQKTSGRDENKWKQEQRLKERTPEFNKSRSKGKPGSVMKSERRKDLKGEFNQSNAPKDSQQSTGKESKPGINKTIIQIEDTDICPDNLRERCKYGEKCNRHHCSLPYHWQFKVPTQPWKSFPTEMNGTLEMNFCSQDNDSIIVSVANDQCQVDLNEMKGKMKDGEITLRRLSTSSACDAPPGETLVTNWTWYWRHDNGKFLSYTNVENAENTVGDIDIEEKYIENQDNIINMKIGSYQYQIDFKNMTQTNIKSKKQREIRRRPQYRSKEDVQKEAKEKRKIPKRVDPKQSSSQQQSGDLPAHWSEMTDDDDEMKRILLKPSEPEYFEVYKVFLLSLGKSDLVVDSIERIQNPYLWQNYIWKKQKMEKQNKIDGVNEIKLYHGTSAENVDPISKTNFDWRLYGSAVGSLYGEGSYFAADAKYSDSGYAQYDNDGYKWMFMVRVLVGKYTRGKPDLRKPPPLDPALPKGRLYDSTVDNPDKPRIYCIFENSQYYPEYIIKYR